jgi:DNA-binding IclR family transcriptional regulator
MQVVVRALSVLKLVARSPRGLALGEIGERLGLPVATAHRIVAVLESERFVTRSTSNRRYFLGPAALELANSDFPRESPLVTAHQAVSEASRKTGETVFLSEFAGDRVICLALSESTYPLRLFVRVGQAMPLHAAAAARVLLAWLSPEKVGRLLANAPLTAYTPETPHTVNAVLDHLADVKRTGYDVCFSELDENVWAVSAPVRSSTNEVVSSITLAAPAQRMEDEATREKAIQVILEAAAEMSADLGWVSAAS